MPNHTVSSGADIASLVTLISWHCSSHRNPALGILHSSQKCVTLPLGRSEACHGPFIHSASQQNIHVSTRCSFQTEVETETGKRKETCRSVTQFWLRVLCPSHCTTCHAPVKSWGSHDHRQQQQPQPGAHKFFSLPTGYLSPLTCYFKALMEALVS